MAWKIPSSPITFLHNKYIISHFSSLLVTSGCFQLTNTTSTTPRLHVQLMVIKHGCHVVSTSMGMFFLFLVQPEGSLKKNSIETIKKSQWFLMVLMFSYGF